MLKNFAHIDTESIDEAAGLLREGAGSSRIIAGGTDLLSVLKHKLEPDYPEQLVNIKTVEGLDHIIADEEGLKSARGQALRHRRFGRGERRL